MDKSKYFSKTIYEEGPEVLFEWAEGVCLRCFLKALKNDDLEKANKFLHALVYFGPEIDTFKEAIKELNFIWDHLIGEKIKDEYVLKKDGDIYEIVKKGKTK